MKVNVKIEGVLMGVVRPPENVKKKEIRKTLDELFQKWKIMPITSFMEYLIIHNWQEVIDS